MHISELPLTIPSPLMRLETQFLKEKKINLFVKRDDLIHRLVQGNKWRKMKYNLLKINELDSPTLLTFGGAFSNHIYSTAAAGYLLGIPTIGVIRGERGIPLSNTLVFAENYKMGLHFVNRERFKNKEATAQAIIKTLDTKNVYILPEGGTNSLALLGCQEIVHELNLQMSTPFDYIVSACGTGGTVAGIIQACNRHQKVIGIAVLKGDFFYNDIKLLLNNKSSADLFLKKSHCPPEGTAQWIINSDYHFGGYAKYTLDLIHFINQFKAEFNIPLDPIYTGKMFYGLFDLIKNDYFPQGSTIVAVHTGGTQGIQGFNEFRLKNSSVKIDV